MHSSVRNLLTGLIDYAGLFPPAGLTMLAAVSNFERYRAGQFGWALGCFIVPAGRLSEFENSIKGLSIPLSVLAGPNLDQDLAHIRVFQQRHPGMVEMIEIKVSTLENVRHAARRVPSEFPIFFEIPGGASSAALMTAIAEEGGCAKIRTGGVTPDAVPSASDVARFIELCSAAGVPFKATAGLHHPVRSLHPLTYEERSPSTVMHGFLNVFLAAGFVRNHMPAPLITELIEEESPAAFRFSEEAITWKDHELTSAEIAATRKDFAIAFGSCSFEEPIEDLRVMGLL